jgi:alpha-D-xyloside xylohydrolase
MRLHGSRRRTSYQVDRHPGVKERSGGDNEIWCFGEKNTPVLASYIHLRERMKPYILACAKRTSETGEPIMRPMFFDFPEDAKCYELDDQYMFGPDILFAPIMESKSTQREVYLPAGKWVRVGGGESEVIEGSKTVTCRAELSEFIAFVREGAEVLGCF